MKKANKYAIEIVQNDGSWSAKIIRRVNRKQTVVSKKQAGFATEAEAQAWGDTELQTFLQNLVERNKRRAADRIQ